MRYWTARDKVRDALQWLLERLASSLGYAVHADYNHGLDFEGEHRVVDLRRTTEGCCAHGCSRAGRWVEPNSQGGIAK